MCCLRLLSATWEFLSTMMSVCALTCRVQCRDVLLCYDSSTASDVQCPTLCFSRWLCRWSCQVSTMATQHLLGLPHLSSVASVGAQCRRQTDSSIFSVRARHTDCKTFTGCGLQNASTSSWLYSTSNACTVCRHCIFPTTSSLSLIPTAAVSSRRHPCS